MIVERISIDSTESYAKYGDETVQVENMELFKNGVSVGSWRGAYYASREGIKVLIEPMLEADRIVITTQDIDYPKHMLIVEGSVDGKYRKVERELKQTQDILEQDINLNITMASSLAIVGVGIFIISIVAIASKKKKPY